MEIIDGRASLNTSEVKQLKKRKGERKNTLLFLAQFYRELRSFDCRFEKTVKAFTALLITFGAFI